MGNIGKSFALILILIMAISSLSLLMVKPAFAQSIPKPSVPQFILKLAERPFDVAPITTIDPYTGKTVTTQNGYHMENKSIEVIITNQPFASYTDSNGNYIGLYYNVASKGHYGNDWTYYPYDKELFSASNSAYTVLSFGIEATVNYNPNALGVISNGSQVDISIRARIGSFTPTSVPLLPDHALSPMVQVNVFNGQIGEWSGIQAISVPDGSISFSSSNPPPNSIQLSTEPSSTSPSTIISSQNPTSTTTVPEFPTLIILPLFAVATLLSIVLIRKIPKKQLPFTFNT